MPFSAHSRHRGHENWRPFLFTRPSPALPANRMLRANLSLSLSLSRHPVEEPHLITRCVTFPRRGAQFARIISPARNICTAAVTKEEVEAMGGAAAGEAGGGRGEGRREC